MLKYVEQPACDGAISDSVPWKCLQCFIHRHAFELVTENFPFCSRGVDGDYFHWSRQARKRGAAQCLPLKKQQTTNSRSWHLHLDFFCETHGFQTFSDFFQTYIVLFLLIVFNGRNLGNLTGLRSLQLSRLSALKRPVSRWSGGQAINLRESGSTRVPGPIPHSPTMKGNPVIRLLSAIVVNGFFRGVFPPKVC